MEKNEYSQLIEAVFIWTGRGRDTWPNRNDSLVINHFGPELGAKLLTTMKVLADDFYSSNANQIAHGVQEMAKMAADHFRQKHPEIPEEIIEVLAWCYTFDFK
jgi:hypothetical protein